MAAVDFESDRAFSEVVPDARMRVWYSGNPSNDANSEALAEIEHLTDPIVADILLARHDFGRGQLDEDPEAIMALKGLLDQAEMEVDPQRGALTEGRLNRLATRVNELAEKSQDKAPIKKDHPLLAKFKRTTLNTNVFTYDLINWIRDNRITVADALDVAQQAGKHLAANCHLRDSHDSRQVSIMYILALFPQGGMPVPNFEGEKPNTSRNLLSIGQAMSIAYLKERAKTYSPDRFAHEISVLERFKHHQYSKRVADPSLLPKEYSQSDTHLAIALEEALRHSGVIYSEVFKTPGALEKYLSSLAFRPEALDSDYSTSAPIMPIAQAAFHEKLVGDTDESPLRRALNCGVELPADVVTLLSRRETSVESEYAQLIAGKNVTFLNAVTGLSISTTFSCRTLEKFGKPLELGTKTPDASTDN